MPSTGDLGSNPDPSSDLMVSIERVIHCLEASFPLLQDGKNSLYFIENF